MIMDATERANVVDRLRRWLESRPEVLFACLHGSFAEDGPYRDIDVAVWLDPVRVPARERTRHALDLAAELSLDLRAPVDVQAVNDAPLAFRYHALGGPVLLVRDPDLFDDVRARTWDEYFDFLPFARQYLMDVLSA